MPKRKSGSGDAKAKAKALKATTETDAEKAEKFAWIEKLTSWTFDCFKTVEVSSTQEFSL